MKNEILKYIIRKQRTGEFVAPFDVKQDGRPTTANLSTWRTGFNASLLTGGANEHLPASCGLHCNLELFNQRTGETVCTFISPLFELV